MESLESRKAEIRDRIEEGVEIVHDLEDERGNLNAARSEADEEDRAELSSAYEQYVRGELTKRPVAYTANRDAVERRAEGIPVEIDKAELEVAQARLELSRLERSEALAAEKAPRKELDRLDREMAQLEKERREADRLVTNARRAVDQKQTEESTLEQQVRHLESAVKARVRISPNRGVVMG